MRGLIDDVEQEIPKRSISGIDRDKSPVILSVRRKAPTRTGVVISDGIHAEGTKRCSRSPLDLDQQRKLLEARSPDDDLAQ